MKPNRWSPRFALIPIIIMAALVVILAMLEIPGTIGPPILLPILNTMFVGLVSLAGVIIAAASFATFGSWSNLMLGGGLLSFAIANLAGGWLMAPLGANTGLTAHNAESLLSSAKRRSYWTVFSRAKSD